MRCYFHSQQNCFLDYFDDPVMDGAVIYVDDIPFQYSEKEGMYTAVLHNPTGNVFLTTSRDHELLLCYRATALHISAESWRSSHNYVKNLSSSITTVCHFHLPIPVTHYIQHIMKQKKTNKNRCSGRIHKSN